MLDGCDVYNFDYDVEVRVRVKVDVDMNVNDEAVGKTKSNNRKD